MRELEFKMERPGLLETGQKVTVTEGVLPSSYYYTIDPSLGNVSQYSIQGTPENKRRNSCIH